MYLTLVSTASLSEFPSNNTGNYTTQLSKPIELNREDWQIALAEITFPNLEGLQMDNLSFRVEKRIINNQYAKEGFTKTFDTTLPIVYDGMEYSISEECHYIMDDTHVYFVLKDTNICFNEPEMFFDPRVTNKTKYPFKFKVRHRFTEKDKFMGLHVREGKLLIPEHDVVSREINVDINQPLLPQFGEYYKDGKIVVEEGKRIILSEKLKQVLGLQNRFLDAGVHAPNARGLKGINSIDSVFIYSDIVENQRVGNTHVPLIRSVRYRKGQTSYVFNPPFYLNIARGNIQTIEVELRTSKGIKIKFGEGETIAVLHFKRK